MRISDKIRLPASIWKTIGATAAAVSLIAFFEGYREFVYKDLVGIPTIGFGSTTSESGEPLKPGEKTTPVRAVMKLQKDLDSYAKKLADCIGDVPLAPNEWTAILSWAYNIGVERACNSTLVKKLKQNPPDYKGACEELLRWNKAGGNVVVGLDRRRRQEYILCIGGLEK